MAVYGFFAVGIFREIFCEKAVKLRETEKSQQVCGRYQKCNQNRSKGQEWVKFQPVGGMLQKSYRNNSKGQQEPKIITSPVPVLKICGKIVLRNMKKAGIRPLLVLHFVCNRGRIGSET